MNILEMVLNAQNGGAASQLGEQFGISEDQARAAISQLVPALSGGVKRNLSQPSGLDDLVGALQNGNHERYYSDQSAIGDDSAVVDGNAILGHLLGNKETSRQVASDASSSTGIDSGILKKMLPIVATMVMGSLGRQSQDGGIFGSGVGSGGAGMDILTSFLDSDGDGSIADDLIGMAGKFFK